RTIGITNLTIAVASADGISNMGSLTVSNSRFFENYSGIANSGTLTLTDTNLFSVLSGVRNTGALTMTKSTLSGGSLCGFGGGLYNSGTALVEDSTVSSNAVYTACLGGGCCYRRGGGIYNAGTLTLANSTLFG